MSSLGRLGVSQVDIVYVHDPDEHVDQAIAEAIPALAELRDQGVIGAIGVGMNQWQAPLRMVREADLDLVMLAGRWTLLDRSGAPLLGACAERGVAVVAAAPYNSGLLARDWPEADTHFNYGRPSGTFSAGPGALAGICRRHGTRLPAAALQFPLRHPAVISVAAGMRTAGEVRRSPATAVRAGAGGGVGGASGRARAMTGFPRARTRKARPRARHVHHCRLAYLSLSGRPNPASSPSVIRFLPRPGARFR